jgi:phosphoribosylanthranilate isomerase
MIVKICGIRTLDEALAAIHAGADMLGFNFYPPSPRFIDLPACKALIDELTDSCLCPAVSMSPSLQGRGGLPVLVGVFVNRAPAEVAAVLDACGLDLAQLSGDEGPEDMAPLRSRAFKAIRPRDLPEARRLAHAYDAGSHCSDPPALLIDASAATGVYGGSGQSADWGVAGGLAGEMPILLAGGLRSDNVVRAIAAVQPWGVDVASGVERAPGIKDPDKMAAFVRIAKSRGA